MTPLGHPHFVALGLKNVPKHAHPFITKYLVFFAAHFTFTALVIVAYPVPLDDVRVFCRHIAFRTDAFWVNLLQRAKEKMQQIPVQKLHD